MGVPRLKCFPRSASVAVTGYSEQCCDNKLVREVCCSDPQSFSYKDFRCGKMISSKVSIVHTHIFCRASIGRSWASHIQLRPRFSLREIWLITEAWKKGLETFNILGAPRPISDMWKNDSLKSFWRSSEARRNLLCMKLPALKRRIGCRRFRTGSHPFADHPEQ